ncbi:unnamed protein product, partial [Mesorhabditis belari]|uniref:Dynein light intermediate chain n=1 Tax=Mesorhabditis belari TaxID=2138241 RepID=A0AAF3FEK8_9BILA
MATDMLSNIVLPQLSNSPRSAAAAAQEEEKIWTRILTDVSAKSRNTLQGSNVIVLGDPKSGKTSLLAKLEKIENAHKGSALAYHCLSVQSDARDSSYAYSLGTAGGALGPAENLALPVWVLDGKEVFAPLLRHALPTSSPSRIVAVLVVSLDNPSPIHSLRRWAAILGQQVTSKYDTTTMSEAKQTQERFWQEYVEPVESSMSSSMMPGLEDTGLLPLEPGVLSENCGVSMVVVVTKSDLASEMNDQLADKILVDIRRFCLQHGAALFYTSSKNIKNTHLLTKYLVHRAYNLPFTTPAQLLDRDSLFVPAGWDGEKKIEIIRENINEAEVLEPTRERPAVAKEADVVAEDTQGFLGKLGEQLNAAQAVASASSTTTTPKKLMEEQANPDSSPLASFFSNLLKDKTTPQRGGAVPEDAQQQFDRMLQGAKSSGSDSNA